MNVQQQKILFVCQGNICRSPLAEGVLNHLIKEHALTEKIATDSAGTISFHSNQPPDKRMTEVAQKHGVLLSGWARQFSVDDFYAYDLILAMDSSNYEDILHNAPGDKERQKVKMFLLFDPEQNDSASVPDPYYGGRQGFETVFAMVKRACDNIIKHYQDGTLFK